MTDWVVGEDMTDDSAETLFQSFLQEAVMSSSGMGRGYILSLMLAIQHFLSRPQRRPPSKVPRRMVLERLSWRVTWPNHASFFYNGDVRRAALHSVGILPFSFYYFFVHSAVCLSLSSSHFLHCVSQTVSEDVYV